MSISLIEAQDTYKHEILQALSEWHTFNQLHPEADTSPMAIFRQKPDDFASYVTSLTDLKPEDTAFVPFSTYFLYCSDNNKVLGAINIRHELNDYLYMYGGHIGYGIVPSERRKGYGVRLLTLGLKKCGELGLNRILICCNNKNVASQKLIKACGGVFENEVEAPDKTIFQRFWIEI